MPVHRAKMNALRKEYGSKRGEDIYYAMEMKDKKKKKRKRNALSM